MNPHHRGGWARNMARACIGGGVLMGFALPRAHADPATQSVWCSITEANSRRLFISDPAHLPTTSRMTVFSYSGRFARTVNMRYGLHYVLVGNYCLAFPTPRRAAIAHADMIAHLADQNFQIVTVGIF
ncbi:hypothetical protein [Komagataeibacter sp. FNDCR2]|uniref:hypothetical protein n=1 Tax=Komagataeibacter sp. FNDCR2 TaxID=2878682 RepID=UPI001E46DF20|nr:hypothetical protein [Komagataeibacter sp. FNDCR2]MCE2574201.1 hypothetical protein [Komagataeibacter sp. FNDCR2]